MPYNLSDYSLLRYRAWSIAHPTMPPDANEIAFLISQARDNNRLQNHEACSTPALVTQFARSLPYFRWQPVCVLVRIATGVAYAWSFETSETSDFSRVYRADLQHVHLPDGGEQTVARWNAIECVECGLWIRRRDSLPHDVCWNCTAAEDEDENTDGDNSAPTSPQASRNERGSILPYDANVLHFYPDAASRALQSPDLLFGIELEFDTPVRGYPAIPHEAIATNLTAQFPVICKTDGSVPRGMEINTIPAPLDEQRQLIQRLLNAIPRGALRTTNGCGLHIHVSRRPMSEDQMARLIVFMNAPQTQELIKQLARRSNDQWARVVPKTLNQAKRDLRGNDKYVALNMSHSATLEFRVFRSSLSQATVCACLEFCAVLCDYCAPTPSDRWLNPTEFYAYVTRRRREFKNLARWIRRVPEAKRLIDDANKQRKLPLCA